MARYCRLRVRGHFGDLPRGHVHRLFALPETVVSSRTARKTRVGAPGFYHFSSPARGRPQALLAQIAAPNPWRSPVLSRAGVFNSNDGGSFLLRRRRARWSCICRQYHGLYSRAAAFRLFAVALAGRAAVPTCPAAALVSTCPRNDPAPPF